MGLLPALIVAGIILINTQSALRTTAEERVSTARDGRAEALETYVGTVQGQITTFAQAHDTVAALRDLPREFANMAAETGVDDASYSDIEASVSDYYRGPFAAQYSAANGEGVEVPSLDVSTLDREAVIAQYAYIAGNKYALGSKDGLVDAGNQTAYDRGHAEIHPGIRSFLKEFGYYDIFLIDAENGRIVYSVFKEIDYGTSLVEGPHAATSLGEAYRAALALGSSTKHAVTGYEKYGPSYDAPASFVASPVYDGRELLGVVAFQLPLDRVSAAVGQVKGLGETGDAYLVGPDQRLWSDSLRNEEFTVLASFQSEKTVSNDAVARALAGETGTVVGLSLSGEESVIAYSPVEFAGSNLALLTLQTEDEAMAAATRALLLSLVVVLIAAAVITFVAVRLNRGMARNVSSMVETIVGQSGDVASGTLLSRSDPSLTPYVEFAPVLASINQMADAFTGQMDAIPVPIVVHDRGLNVQFANAAAARLAQRDASELLGSTYYEATGPAAWREPSFSTRQTLTLGSASETVSQWQTPLGERDIRSVQTPIEVEGKVVGALETLLDETEVRTSERRQQKVAEYSSRAVERLTVAFEHITAGDLTVAFDPGSAADDDVEAAAVEFDRVASGFAKTMTAFRETIETTRANAARTAA
ncbi:MAG: cache domain-containing protein, partial [Nannocystaceae bacterium]|nr:cache domain-containing protein [Nannocystaceae bacterium]